MAASRKSAARKPRAKKCPACKGTGQTAVTVQVGGRKKRDSGHHQNALCLECLGSGTTS